MVNAGLISMVQERLEEKGRISVERGLCHGSVFLDEGRVVHAETNHSQGIHAFFSMFLWEDSFISWHPEIDAPLCTLGSSAVDLLIQLAQLEDSGQLSEATLAILFPDSVITGIHHDFSQCRILLHSTNLDLPELDVKLVKGDYILGSSPDCDVVIEHPTISRKHCVVGFGSTQIRVIDLGSSNGTFINGTLISESMLNPGDHLRLGEMEFEVILKMARHWNEEGDLSRKTDLIPVPQVLSTGMQSGKVTQPIRFQDFAGKSGHKSLVRQLFGK